MFAGDDQLHW